MAKYRIAELLVEFTPRYALALRACQDYLVETEERVDFSISVSDEEIAETQKSAPEQSLAFAENFCIFRRFTEEAAKRGAILFHAAAVEVGGFAYAFSAPSGTGKSTHITLWRRRFGRRVGIINGDKPFLREKDGVFTVYGSPWCGKEGWNKNVCAPLKALCFLSRAEENAITPLSHEEALPRVFAQMLKPKDEAGVRATVHLADLLIREVPIYSLACNISPEAAELSFRTMSGTEPPEREWLIDITRRKRSP